MRPLFTFASSENCRFPRAENGTLQRSKVAALYSGKRPGNRSRTDVLFGMATNVFNDWCETKKVDVTKRHKLHIFLERDGARSVVQNRIDDTVASHYDEPARLADRISRLGYSKAAKILRAMLPQTKRARSGQLGEILATEAVPIVLSSFDIPVKRLRWSDDREMAMRGEDLIGVSTKDTPIRFLKGESK